jgi:hypothetical protein
MLKKSDQSKAGKAVRQLVSNNITEEAQMAEHGIKRVLVKNYFYGNYRYTSFQDALSQAKRDSKI